MVLLLLKWQWIPPWLQPVVASFSFLIRYGHPQGVWCWGFVQWYPGRLSGPSLQDVATWNAAVPLPLGWWELLFIRAASILLKRLKIDDPVDACPVHCFWWCLGSYGFRIVWLGQGALTTTMVGVDSADMENDDGSCQTGIGVHALAAHTVLWSWLLPPGQLPTSGFLFYGLKRSGMLAYQWPGWSLRIGKTKASKICGRFGYRPHAVKMVSIQITTILASPIFPKAASCRADSTKNHGQSSTQWRLVRVRDQTYLAAIAAIAAGGCQTHQGGIVRLPMKASQNSACSV